MVCIKSDCFFFFSGYFYREWLTKLIGKINLLTYSKIFGTWKLCDFQGKNCLWIRLSISLFRHQVNINYLTNFHICNCCIKSPDHLSCTANEFKRFPTVIRGVKLCSIVKSTSVMCTAGLTYVTSCKCSVRTTSTTTAASTGVSARIPTGMSLFMMMVITGSTCRCQFSFKISFYRFICVTLCPGAYFNSSFCKCCLCTASDSSTDQNTDSLFSKKSCQCAVSCSIGTNHFTGNNLIILYFINLKCFCFSKVLKNISIIIGCCNFHCKKSSL